MLARRFLAIESAAKPMTMIARMRAAHIAGAMTDGAGTTGSTSGVIVADGAPEDDDRPKKVPSDALGGPV